MHKTHAKLGNKDKVHTLLFDYDAPPCPNGPCTSCHEPCPTAIVPPDGVYESLYMIIAGMRHFVAIRNGLICAAGEVPVGRDSARMIERLHHEVTSGRPLLSSA